MQEFWPEQQASTDPDTGTRKQTNQQTSKQTNQQTDEQSIKQKNLSSKQATLARAKQIVNLSKLPTQTLAYANKQTIE